MFSGVVAGKSKIVQIEKHDETIKMTVSYTDELLKDIKIGDSISVNGTCLTVEEFDQNSFVVTMMPQTFKKTTFKNLNVGDEVNLEQAMGASSRFEGHIVSGHIDEVIKVVDRHINENAIELWFTLPKRLNKQVVAQGSVALNGVSLTVMDVKDDTFSIGLIPHTQDKTNLSNLQIGDELNLETDILGKYVEANLVKEN
ncbi:riboflavin synthase [Lactobacillus colini]|uniref:Riboflavin synthase n=1 Tax=Lactobacillus colini TaxID=1819254 RepID=A0ABS4MD42_9LACO|nr:riboflavin synthase [Lactobacillus colini]MBP2057523.1 riboflavin synthase [Lactobacillus colini]